MKKAENQGLNFDNIKFAFGHKTNAELKFSIFIFNLMKNPGMVRILTKLTLFALKIKLPITGLVKKTIFQQFCGGEDINDCASSIEALGRSNVKSILDYSVEGEQAEESFTQTQKEIIAIANSSKGNPNIPVTCIKLTGVIRFGLLEKFSTDRNAVTADELSEMKNAMERLKAICEACVTNDVPIYIDAEESWIQPEIDFIAEALMNEYNKEKAIIFNTLQMYRHDRLVYLKELHGRCAEKGTVLGVKIVRGAYMEKERARAAEKGYASPIQSTKENSDKDYDAAIEYIVKNIEQIEICAGTHNEESCYKLAALMEANGLPKDHKNIYFSQLYGMSDQISFNLAANGYNVSKYLPYGPVIYTMPYLIRRAEENTSISGQVSKELTLLLQEKKRRKG